MSLTRLSVEEASAHTLAGITPLAEEGVELRDALGRVLARDVASPVSLPPWDTASMDGFAVRADDVRGATRGAPVRLRVTETIAAGQRPRNAVEAGEAVRIMTGAPVPRGADSVVRVEDTTSDEASVTIVDDRDAGANVRARGEDVGAGDVVLRAGTTLAAPRIGVLSSVGAGRPIVHRRPRVAILATGDELVMLDGFAGVLAGTRIVSSNSYSLEAAVREAGGEPVPLGIAPDDPAGLAERLRAANGCDAIVTSGGVSVGDFDYTRRVVSELGGELSLWRVRMRPGAPLGFGRLFGVPWLGLPGNPVSALVTFELFGRPLLRALAGASRPHRRTVPVVLDEEVTLRAPLAHFLRCVIVAGDDDALHARLTGSQSSGMLTSMSVADALLVVPAEPAVVRAGTRLRALPLSGDFGGSARVLA
ncbi:MAG TPA: gephyrin-like molybdotransferase Glp [Gemmatimonadaceae bacterium]|nr:gephyrin-like molybdotransferase Glp [Gemmatimonadaceae bacterium]